MENRSKSKAFIIAFILILILLILGYYFWTKRDQLFGTKGTISTSKVFSPLFGTSKNKNLTVVNPDQTGTTVTTEPGTGENTQTGPTWTSYTDEFGNQVVQAQAGENLKKGDVLYLAGINSNNSPIVMKAIANDPIKSQVFGVASEDIPKDSMGKIIVTGVLTGVPTNRKEITPWAVNNILYLSDKIFGGMTKNAPVSPSLVVPVGSVLKVDSVNGSIRIGLGSDGKPLFNPISIPATRSPSGSIGGAGTGINGNGNSSNGGNNGTGNHGTGNNGSNNNSETITENKCVAIEQNPLTFTEDEKARLTVLLRKFYLISSTLKTQDDITAISNEIDQYNTFISQIEGLTKQCYTQIPDAMMAANGWVRHGNPWYTKSSSGTFPYTSENNGYLRYDQLEGGMTKAGLKVISGYYYGKTSSGEDCNKYNTFEGYGLPNQINNKKEIYTGHYYGSGTNSPEANSEGYPGDSLMSYGHKLDERQPDKKLLENGCSWKDGVILDNTERLLNIW